MTTAAEFVLEPGKTSFTPLQLFEKAAETLGVRFSHAVKNGIVTEPVYVATLDKSLVDHLRAQGYKVDTYSSVNGRFNNVELSHPEDDYKWSFSACDHPVTADLGFYFSINAELWDVSVEINPQIIGGVSPNAAVHKRLYESICSCLATVLDVPNDPLYKAVGETSCLQGSEMGVCNLTSLSHIFDEFLAKDESLTLLRSLADRIFDPNPTKELYVDSDLEDGILDVWYSQLCALANRLLATVPSGRSLK